MTIIETFKDRLNTAKEAGAIPVKDADAVVGIAEGIDDEILFQVFKALLLTLHPYVGRVVYHALIAMDGAIPEKWKEKVYLDELKAAADFDEF